MWATVDSFLLHWKTNTKHMKTRKRGIFIAFCFRSAARLFTDKPPIYRLWGYINRIQGAHLTTIFLFYIWHLKCILRLNFTLEKFKSGHKLCMEYEWSCCNFTCKPTPLMGSHLISVLMKMQFTNYCFDWWAVICQGLFSRPILIENP